MSWARMMAPLAGAPSDAEPLAAAAVIAQAFGAELAGVYTPADIADVMPWMGEGFLGGVQTTALELLREATSAGEASARKALEAVSYANKTLVTLETPVWAGLSVEGRLSDVVVFGSDSARGRGPLAEAFSQIVADEQRPTLVARPGLVADGVVAVAWDGGKEASRAARTALPLLQKASKVVILAAPQATSRKFEPNRLADFLAARQVKAEVQTISGSGDAAGMLLSAVAELGASLMVAGAFGHPRLQEFIFGGTTRSLLGADKPSLFLSH